MNSQTNCRTRPPSNGRPVPSMHVETATVLACSKPLGWPGVEVVQRLFREPGALSAPAGLAGHTFTYWRQQSGRCWIRARVGDCCWEGSMSAGEALLAPAGLAADWEWDCDGRGCQAEVISLSLSPSLLATVAAGAGDADPDRVAPVPFHGLADPHLRYLAEAFLAEVTAGGPGGRLVADSLANLLAVHLLRRHVPRRPRRRPAALTPSLAAVRRAEAYIRDNLAADLALADLAAAAHLSVYHFCRLFKQATGLAPHQYVLRERVERAKRLLRDQADLPLAEVAARTGFSDQSHFTRHFKRLAGVTPGRFRQ
jgi:AraC family transcriptional regulator